jgi:hypothetical protein
MNHRTTEPVEDALVVDRWKFAIVRLAVLGDLSFAKGLDAAAAEMLPTRGRANSPRISRSR